MLNAIQITNKNKQEKRIPVLGFLFCAFGLLMSFEVLAKINFENTTYCLYAENQKCTVLQTLHQTKTDITLGVSEQAKFNEPYLNVLNTYYLLAKQNNLPEIVKLYSSQDGSRELVREAVRRTPTRYARFHKVGDIKINQIFNMGSYYAFAVSWFDKQGKRLANWFELVQCSGDACFMSERFARKDEKTAFYSLFGQSTAFTGEFAVSNAVEPIKVVKPQNSSSPVSLSLAIEPYEQMSKTVKSRFEPVTKVVNLAVSNYLQVMQEVGTDVNRLEGFSKGMFDPYWENFSSKEMFFYPNSKGQKHTFSTMDFRIFSNRLGNLKSLEPAALLRANQVDFVMLWGAQNADKKDERLFIFPVSKQGKIVNWSALKRQDATIFELLQHPFVYVSLIKSLKSGTSNTQLIAADKSQYEIDFKKLEPQAPKSDSSKPSSENSSQSYWLWLALAFVLVLVVGLLIWRKRN